MGVVLRWPRHIEARHEKTDACHEDRCQSCILSTCGICLSSEGEQPTHCPGGRMTHYQRGEVMAGRLDYTVTGGWEPKGATYGYRINAIEE